MYGVYNNTYSSKKCSWPNGALREINGPLKYELQSINSVTFY